MTKEELKKLRRTIRFHLIKSLICCLGLLPISKIKKIKLLLLKAIKIFGKKELTKAYQNLPSEFENRKQNIVNGIMNNQVMTILEVIFYDKLKSARPELFKFEGWEVIEEIQKSGKTPLILTGHFCNWEVLGYELVKKGIDLTVIARPNNLNQMTEFINSFREKHGMKVVMQNNIVEAIKLLHQGKPAALLADLNAREWGYQVDFFEKNASFYSAPVIISVRSGMPLIPIFTERQQDGTLLFKINKAITWEKGESIKDKVQKVAKVYEDEYRKRPDLWCWFHDRYTHAEMGKIK